MTEVFRTPDAAFVGLPGFSWSAQYRQWEGLRLAHVDEGPRDAPVALLIHGEPTWGYLYRSMVPPLLEAGFRVVVPDHPGFGRSDKPIDDNWYTIARHVAALKHLIETLDLHRVTLVVQDWGGPIGLRQATTMPDRFDRLVILNTWLHHDDFDYSEGLRRWRDMALDPAALGGDMPTGAIVAGTLTRADADRPIAFQAYSAPFPTEGSKAGARRFPFCIPFAEPMLGQAAEQAHDFAVLPTLPMPKHVIFGDSDPIFPVDWGKRWAGLLPDTTFDAIPGAGHFLQEEAGAEIIAVLLARIAAERGA